MKPLAGTVYQWTALVPFYQQNLSSSVKGQAKVSLSGNVLTLGLGEANHLCWYLLSINQIQFYNGLTTFTVPLVVVFTKFDGQVINESANLSDTEDEDKWEKARQIAESIFQTVYLPKVLDTKYPPKAFVRLEGENGEHPVPKNANDVVQ